MASFSSVVQPWLLYISSSLLSYLCLHKEHSGLGKGRLALSQSVCMPLSVTLWIPRLMHDGSDVTFEREKHTQRV